MPDTDQWPPSDLDASSAVKWALAFTDGEPDTRQSTYKLSIWFLAALRAGYKAGMSHAEFPEA